MSPAPTSSFTCSARVYPLEALLLDCHKYFQVTGRRITFEYTLMAGVNDSVAQVRLLLMRNERAGPAVDETAASTKEKGGG